MKDFPFPNRFLIKVEKYRQIDYNKTEVTFMEWKRGCDVNCRETQRLIVPFIKSELTMEQAKFFFQHIDNCPDCKEELEVYYMMMVGMKELDEDSPQSLDLHSQFEELLDRSRTEINKHHLRKTPRMVLFLALIGVLLVLITREQEHIAEQESVQKRNEKLFDRLPEYDPLVSFSNLKKGKNRIGVRHE